MKRLYSFIISVLFLTQLNAQDAADALRYSQTYPGGTARSLGMGGAFGSLGADFYSVTQNPAGIGMYRRSEFTFTPALHYTSANSRYWGNETNDYRYNFNINNLGYVKSFQFSDEGFVAANIALGFNRLNNFNTKIYTSGINYFNSMAHSMAESANNNGNPVGIDDLLPFDEWLFYDGELIYDQADGFYAVEPDIDYSLDTIGSGIQQIQTFESKGRMNEWIVAAGFNIHNIVYIGTTFSLVNVVYQEDKGYNEFDGEDSQWEFYYFDNSMKTSGLGVTGKFGLIVRPVSFFRIGAAYHLPVWYSMDMTYDSYLESRYTEPAWITIGPQDSYGNNIDYGESKFKLTTPAKFVGSVSFTIGKIATLAVDVEQTNYAKMRLKDTYVTYPEDANEVINDIYKNAWNVKTGGEVRFGKLYLRGGFNYYQSPYVKGELNENADQYMVTSGIGLRNRHFSIDFAYAYHFYDERSILYAYQTRYNTVNYDLAKSRFMMTLGFRFQ